MPILKASKKGLKQSLSRASRNKSTKSRLKDLLKDFQKAVIAKDHDKASKLISQVYKALDLTAKKNIFHVNKSSRLKSRYAKMLAGISVKAAK